jgi:hypothetical protein
LDDRCLGVVPRAFENWQGTISPVLKSSKLVVNNQFSFEKQAAQRPPLLKAEPWPSRQFRKAFSKFKKLLMLTG